MQLLQYQEALSEKLSAITRPPTGIRDNSLGTRDRQEIETLIKPLKMDSQGSRLDVRPYTNTELRRDLESDEQNQLKVE